MSDKAELEKELRRYLKEKDGLRLQVFGISRRNLGTLADFNIKIPVGDVFELEEVIEVLLKLCEEKNNDEILQRHS